MSRIDTIFCDVGGVCLTNGWDTDARRAAASHFSLDLEEMEERHETLANALERGERSLDEYLDQLLTSLVPRSNSCVRSRCRCPTQPFVLVFLLFS